MKEPPIDWTDLSIRLRHAQEAYDRLKLAYDELQAQAFALVWQIPGTIKLEDIRRVKADMYRMIQENNSNKAFRDADRDKIRELVDTVDRAVKGTPDEALALELNEARYTNRCWVSWAGQARTFRKDALALLDKVGTPEANAYSQHVALFLNRVRDGAYDIISMPGDDNERHPRPDADRDSVADDGGRSILHGFARSGVPAATAVGGGPGGDEQGPGGAVSAGNRRPPETGRELQGGSARTGDSQDEASRRLHVAEPGDLPTGSCTPGGRSPFPDE